jgi:HlyD family secretion protein
MRSRKTAPTALTALAIAALLTTACREEPTGVRGSGTVEAGEITVAARVQGELLSIDIAEGSRVEKGEVMARIDAEDLELQLEQSRQQLKRARAQLDLLLEGARAEDLLQAEAQLEQAKEGLELARTSYERMKRLREGGSATPSELDRVKAEYEKARSRVKAAEAQLEKLRSGPRRPEIETARARAAEAEAGVQRLENRLQDAAVTAPRSGTVTTVAGEAGEYVRAGTPLFTIADLSEVYLTIFVPEPSLGRISLGQKAEISVDGMPNETFTGTVTHIAEEAEFTPKNVQTQDARAQLVYAVELTVDNSRGIFKIGMPADARITEASEARITGEGE